MDKTGEYILCLNHDARFRVEDGVCIGGPCLGQRLKPVTVRVNGNGYVTFVTGP
jgi:nitrite reductase/ring-hydroxylating ferredoxin subunit